MAGKKGRSGGARPNTGGVRPGAGHPHLRPKPVVIEDETVVDHEVIADEFAQLVAPPAVKMQPNAGVVATPKTSQETRMDKLLQAKLEWMGMVAEAPLPMTDDPKAFLTAVMNHPKVDARMRVDAAKTLMPFIHSKLAEQGKKSEREEAARQASKGRFASAQPPKLAIVNGK